MFQTNRLVIIAGPIAVGKSTLLERLRQGDVPHLCGQLGIDLPSSYLYLDAVELLQVRQSSVDRLVLHYDFLSQYSPRGGFAHLSDLIGRACSVIVLTLCTSSEVLFQRTTSRLTKTFASFLCGFGTHRAKKLLGQWRTRETYRSASNLFALYEEWSEFIEECSVAKHLILDQASSSVTMTRPYERNEVKMLTGALTE